MEKLQYDVKNNSRAKYFIFFEISHRFDNQITYQLLKIQSNNIFIWHILTFGCFERILLSVSLTDLISHIYHRLKNDFFFFLLKWLE